jgi:hypothetical protein
MLPTIFGREDRIDIGIFAVIKMDARAGMQARAAQELQKLITVITNTNLTDTSFKGRTHT